MEELIYFIAGKSYKLSVDKRQKEALQKYLKSNSEQELEIKDLLFAYIKRTKENLELEDRLEQLSQKLPDVST